MFNFVVSFEVCLALVFQSACLAVQSGYVSSCSVSSLAQLMDTGWRGRSPDRLSIVCGLGALRVRVRAGREVVRCSQGFGFCVLSPLCPWWLLWSESVSCSGVLAPSPTPICMVCVRVAWTADE